MKFFFLSGLPRSGSTLLGSIIAQNKDFTVSPTSPILDLLCATNDIFKRLYIQYTFDWEIKTTNVYSSIIEGYFKDVSTPYVLDKHRGYPKNIVPLKMFFSPEPKILCTVRPIPDIISSYISLIKKNKQEQNFIDNALISRKLKITTENRANILWENYLQDSLQSLTVGLTNFRQNIHTVHYDDLVQNPEKTMESIYEFFTIEKFPHLFENIENKCSEDKDYAWGLNNLHKIRTTLKKTSIPAKKVLGKHLENSINSRVEKEFPEIYAITNKKCLSGV
jgi:sulfotransferase